MIYTKGVLFFLLFSFAFPQTQLGADIDGEAAEGGGPGPHGSSEFGVNIGGCGVWDGGGNWVTGAIDEVAIFHSALEDADIKAIMKDGFGNLLAVAAKGKLPVYWSDLKRKK